MELSIALIAGVLVTVVAASLNIPAWLLIASYPVCFAVGFGAGQWQRHHDT